MKAKELKALLRDVDDDVEVILEINCVLDEYTEIEDLIQSSLLKASLEERCDEKMCLYLSGNSEEEERCEDCGWSHDQCVCDHETRKAREELDE